MMHCSRSLNVFTISNVKLLKEFSLEYLFKFIKYISNENEMNKLDNYLVIINFSLHEA